MRIKIVNENRKDIAYIIADSSPELNLPTIKEGKKLIIKNKFSGKTHLVTVDELRRMFPYLINRYNVFFKNLIPECSTVNMSGIVSGSIICSDNENRIEYPFYSPIILNDIEWNNDEKITREFNFNISADLHDKFFIGLKDLIIDQYVSSQLPVSADFITSKENSYSLNLNKLNDEILIPENQGAFQKDSKLENLKLNIDYIGKEVFFGKLCDDLNQMLLDFIDRIKTIRFEKDDQIPFENVFYIEMLDTYFDVNGVKVPFGFNFSTYDKDEFDEMTKNEIDSIIEDFNNRKNEYLSKYITEIISLNVPKLHEFEKLNFNISDINVPEVVSSDYLVSFPEMHILEELKDIEFNVSALTELQEEMPTKFDDIYNEIQTISSSLSGFDIIDDIKKFTKIKFRTFDQTKGNPITINDIKINDEYIHRFKYHYEEIDNKFVYFYEDEVSNPFKITFVKKGYTPVSFLIKPKFATSIDDVETLDLGDIYLFNEGMEMLFTLTWGKVPEDLDFHIYSFNQDFVQLEHVYFENMHSPISDIYLDYDDTSSYGPEHVQIFNLDKEKYYLFCVHNYSLMKYNLEDDAHMNYEGKTTVRISFYRNIYDIIPKRDGGIHDYWLDAFVIHDEKFYILNSFASYLRSPYQDFHFETCKYELEKVKEKIKNAEIVLSFEDFRNSNI